MPLEVSPPDMAYSENSFLGNGVNKNFSITFPYLSKSHIEVYVGASLKTSGVDYSWLNDTTIQFVTAPANATNVIIRRSSNRQARLVDYQDASVLNEATLDADGNQTLYIAQEAFDYVDRAVTQGAFGGVAPSASNIGVDPSGDLSSTDVQSALVELQGDIDAVELVNTSQASSISTLQNQNNATNFGRRNRLINGCFRIDQRSQGAAIGLTTSNQFVVDRWAVALGSALVGTITGQSVATGDATSPYALRLLKSSGAYASTIISTQVIESFDSAQLAGQTCVVKYRARRGSAFAGTVSAIVHYGTGTDQGVNSCTAGTWTGYTFTTLSNNTPGTGFAEYAASVAVPSGTTEVAVTLVMTNTSATGSANNWVEFSNVQFYRGNIDLPFEHRPVAEELMLCQRFFERGSSMPVRNFGTAGSNDLSAQIYFKVTKRAVPTATIQTGTVVTALAEGLTVFQSAIAAGTYYSPGAYTAAAEI